jgi:sec-independent protein translocase protein TatB
MFGMSFGEIIMIAVVGILVVGPKELPKMLRKAGQWSGKLRRMALDLRVQSGIDDALRMEGLSDDIAEIRKLARGELDGVHHAVRANSLEAGQSLPTREEEYRQVDDSFLRMREYPRDGADSYDAVPDVVVSTYPLPRSSFAKDALYMTGDIHGELPPEPPAPEVALTEPAEPLPSTTEATIEAPSASESAS